jgi:hypothetical protein
MLSAPSLRFWSTPWLQICVESSNHRRLVATADKRPFVFWAPRGVASIDEVFDEIFRLCRLPAGYSTGKWVRHLGAP